MRGCTSDRAYRDLSEALPQPSIGLDPPLEEIYRDLLPGAPAAGLNQRLQAAATPPASRCIFQTAGVVTEEPHPLFFSVAMARETVTAVAAKVGR